METKADNGVIYIFNVAVIFEIRGVAACIPKRDPVTHW